MNTLAKKSGLHFGDRNNLTVDIYNDAIITGVNEKNEDDASIYRLFAKTMMMMIHHFKI